jgi:hypothetical protein
VYLALAESRRACEVDACFLIISAHIDAKPLFKHCGNMTYNYMINNDAVEVS